MSSFRSIAGCVVVSACAFSACGPVDGDSGGEADDAREEGLGDAAPSAEGARLLVNVMTARCADVSWGDEGDGVAVWSWACHGGKNQRWKVAARGDGYHPIVDVLSGQCLTVRGASKADGAVIEHRRCDGKSHQAWKIEAESGATRIIAKHSGKCLNVDGGRAEDGAKIQQWSCHQGQNQRWSLRRPSERRTLKEIGRVETLTESGFGAFVSRDCGYRPPRAEHERHAGDELLRPRRQRGGARGVVVQALRAPQRGRDRLDGVSARSRERPVRRAHRAHRRRDGHFMRPLPRAHAGAGGERLQDILRAGGAPRSFRKRDREVPYSLLLFPSGNTAPFEMRSPPLIAHRSSLIHGDALLGRMPRRGG